MNLEKPNTMLSEFWNKLLDRFNAALEMRSELFHSLMLIYLLKILVTTALDTGSQHLEEFKVFTDFHPYGLVNNMTLMKNNKVGFWIGSQKLPLMKLDTCLVICIASIMNAWWWGRITLVKPIEIRLFFVQFVTGSFGNVSSLIMLRDILLLLKFQRPLE